MRNNVGIEPHPAKNNTSIVHMYRDVHVSLQYFIVFVVVCFLSLSLSLKGKAQRSCGGCEFMSDGDKNRNLVEPVPPINRDF